MPNVIRVCDKCSNIDIEKLKNNFEEMKREEKEIINKLKKSIPKIKEMSYKAGDYLAELVEG